MRTTNAAGGYNTRFRSETDENPSFKSAFGNDDRSSRRQISRLEGEVDWRARTRASEYKRTCEPSVFLFAGAKIVLVKSELAGLNSALVVAVGDDEQRHVVITRIPELKVASFVLPESWHTDYGSVSNSTCVLGKLDRDKLIQCASQIRTFLLRARKGTVVVCV